MPKAPKRARKKSGKEKRDVLEGVAAFELACGGD
jgi:hypothetical protein